MSTKAVVYVRVSTTEQADHGSSISAQIDKCKSYCNHKNIEIVDIIEELGVSGSIPIYERPGGKKLLQLLNEKKANAIVTIKIDRISRSASDFLESMDSWDKQGVAIHFIDLGGDSVNTKSATGRFLIVIMSAAAELEKNMIRDRTKSTLQFKKSIGQRTGTIPAGYSVAEDGKTLVHNKEEHFIVQIVHSMRKNGEKLDSIKQHLDNLGIRNRLGNSFTVQQISKISKMELKDGNQGSNQRVV